ncbi:MAG: hypothetical protein AAFQ09_06450 [Pseudomonadota bacterium]
MTRHSLTRNSAFPDAPKSVAEKSVDNFYEEHGNVGARALFQASEGFGLVNRAKKLSKGITAAVPEREFTPKATRDLKAG